MAKRKKRLTRKEKKEKYKTPAAYRRVRREQARKENADRLNGEFSDKGA